MSYKTIFTDSRSGRCNFGWADDDGSVFDLTWKQYLAKDIPESENAEKRKVLVMKYLLSSIKQFNRRLDANMAIRKINNVDDQISYLLRNTTAKWPRNGAEIY